MVTADFSNLFSALFNCFLIIIFGYAAGRLNLITPTQGHGIGSFIGYFALPALLFKSMVELNFETVSWTFMLAIFLAKAVIFIAVVTISLLVLRRKGLGVGSLYAIFATQSNDFALGYPIVKVLYGQTYKELLQYIYLLAPISLLILNPIGFTLLEIDKQWRKKQEAEVIRDAAIVDELISTPCDACSSSESCVRRSPTDRTKIEQAESCPKLILKTAKALLLNPIVTMVFVGLAFHFIFHGKIPGLLSLLLTTLSNAFSATALFYLGLSMVGKLGKQRGVRLFVPGTLIIVKILLFPILARELLLLLGKVVPILNPHTNGTMDTSLRISVNNNHTHNMSYESVLANYAFLYGTFPTAPSVIIYAAKYGLEVDRMATGMVVCTSLSAPIMYVSAWTLSISSMDYSYFIDQVALTDQDVSIVGMLCSIWCIIIFIFSKKFQRIPHLFMCVLTCAMFIASSMTVVNDFAITSISTKAEMYAAFFFFYFGVKATRLYAAALAIALVVLKYYGEQKLRQWCWLFIGIPALFSAFVAAVVMGLGNTQNSRPGNPVFMFGRAQDIASFSLILISLVTVIICLIFLSRLSNLFDNKRVKPTHNYSRLDTHSISSEGNSLVSNDDSDNDSDNFSSLDEDDGKLFTWTSGHPEIARHVVLLILLAVSLFIGIVLTGWRVFQSEISGIYFEIAFLDSVFNFGQAFFVFLIFGFDEELVIDPILRIWHRLVKGNAEISLKPLEDVGQDVLRQCNVFVKHHISHCKRDLLRSKRSGLHLYNNVLIGADLCSWLVEVGLAADRHEAWLYGRNLILGRVLRHVKKQHHFYDKNFLYKFECQTRQVISDPARKTNRQQAEGDSANGQPTSAPCGREDCVLGSKQYSFEQYLNDLADSSTASPARLARGTIMKPSSSYCSETFSEPDSSRGVMNEVAESTADLLTFTTDGTEAQQRVRATVHSRLDETDFTDW